MSFRCLHSRRELLKSVGVLAAVTALPKWFIEETLDAAAPLGADRRQR